MGDENSRGKSLASAGKIMAGIGLFIVIINYLQVNIFVGFFVLVLGVCIFVKGDDMLHPERYAEIKAQLRDLRKAQEEDCKKRGTTPEEEYLFYTPPELPSFPAGNLMEKSKREG